MTSHDAKDARSDGWVALAVAVGVAIWFIACWPTPAQMVTDFDWGHQLSGASQILDGEHPFVDWRTDYGPLRYYASALAQRLLGARTLSELLLTTAGMVAAYAVFFHLLVLATRRRAMALAGLVAALLVAPKLSKYYMVLGPLLCLWAIWADATRQTARSLALVVAAIAVTVLFRTDFGAFALLAAAAAVATGRGSPRQRLWRLSTLAAWTLVALSPWLLWLAARGGLGAYVSAMLLTAPRHARSMVLGLPVLRLGASMAANAGALLFAAVAATPALAALAVCSTRLCPDREQGRRIAIAALLAQAVALHALHRADIGHLFEAAAPCVLLICWLTSAVADAWAPPRGGRRGLHLLAPAAVTALTLTWCVAAGRLPHPRGPRALEESVQLHALPRGEFLARLAERIPTNTVVQAARYIGACTAPGAHVAALAPLSMLPYFADRPFAGGQPSWSPGFFDADRDQRDWIAMVRRQAPVLVVGNLDFAFDGRPERALPAYAPLIVAAIESDFEPIGAIGAFVVRAPRGFATPAGPGQPPPCVRP